MKKQKNNLIDVEERDVLDSYFECITECSLDGDGAECMTRCVEIHLKEDCRPYLNEKVIIK